jgi:hypothetical protein
VILGRKGYKKSPPTFLTLTTEFKNIAQSHGVGGHKSSMPWLWYFIALK